MLLYCFECYTFYIKQCVYVEAMFRTQVDDISVHHCGRRQTKQTFVLLNLQISAYYCLPSLSSVSAAKFRGYKVLLFRIGSINKIHLFLFLPNKQIRVVTTAFKYVT